MNIVKLVLVLGLIGIVAGSYSCIFPPVGSFYGESHECVALVKYACHAPQTALWKQGVHVKGAALRSGTAIATFPNGKYFGHAAIYRGQDASGIQVEDQWNGQPAHYRTIRWNGSGISNNGDSFYVIN
eukprot:TRINITY_DN18540_c0_g1_i1.p1 TRINITY_DN18540_c0_g1~~TRINITY_DN18540_c0_g1_i1.p1  ORF type:complete len:144 (-),score=30.22 TRINITY_DN18540_c0_g1_i1:82-465(-)